VDNDDYEISIDNLDGFPVFQSVQQAESDLLEIRLREQHPELQNAYEEYQILLGKYGFWDKITK